MQNLSRSILSVGRVVSAPPRRWPPALARREAPLRASTSAHLHQHLDRLSRSWSMQHSTGVRNEKQHSIGVRSEKKHSKLQSHIPLTCATTKCMETANMRKKARMDTTNMKKKARMGVTDNNANDNYIWFPSVLQDSSHRDGAIYKNERLKKDWIDFDITDRNETRFESMMFSKRCLPDAKKYMCPFAQHMLQFFSLTLAECPISIDPIQLYGYIAVRDDMDGMLSYISNHSRDNPIILQQGSLIEMTGPKRGIQVDSPVLVEFDMRIKNGEQEENDLQLIDGVIECYNQRPWKPVISRIVGNCGAVDVSLASIDNAVLATIEVIISDVQNGFRLSLSSLVDIMEKYEEIQLFDGTIDQSCGLRRFVVAVLWGTDMILKLKVGNNNVERYRSFRSMLHGCASRLIKLELASVSVKVTWSTV